MTEAQFVPIQYAGHIRSAEVRTYTSRTHAFAALRLLHDINPTAEQTVRERHASVIAAIANEPDDLALGQSPEASNVRPFLAALWRTINASLPPALYWGWASEYTYRNDVGVWYKQPIWPSTGRYAYRQDDPQDDLHQYTLYGPRPDHGDMWVIGHQYPVVRVPIVSIPPCDTAADNQEEAQS